jgi:hypothetical protein
MSWTSFGLRDGLLLLVALVAIYLVVMLLRFVQVGRQRRVQHESEPALERMDTVSPRSGRAEPELDFVPMGSSVPAVTGAAAYAAAKYAAEAAREAPAADPLAATPAPTFAWEDVKELFGETPERTVGEEMVAPRRTGFGEHLADHLARSDVEMEVQRMRDEMERMRAEMEELRAARRVSPQYAEAMELAQRGHPAQDVADRLGISLAEAELVQALSRGGKNFDEGEDNGADTNVTGAAGATGKTGFDEFDRRSD